MTQDQLMTTLKINDWEVKPKGDHCCKVFTKMGRKESLKAVSEIVGDKPIQFIHSDNSVVVYNY